MTFEEHVARAALMGRTFDWRDGTYVANDSLGDYIDCVTLEMVALEECNRRMSRVGTKHADIGMERKDYDRWQQRYYTDPLPWITSGGNDDF
jgi:hypothetical protein